MLISSCPSWGLRRRLQRGSAWRFALISGAFRSILDSREERNDINVVLNYVGADLSDSDNNTSEVVESILISGCVLLMLIFRDTAHRVERMLILISRDTADRVERILILICIIQRHCRPCRASIDLWIQWHCRPCRAIQIALFRNTDSYAVTA